METNIILFFCIKCIEKANPWEIGRRKAQRA